MGRKTAKKQPKVKKYLIPLLLLAYPFLKLGDFALKTISCIGNFLQNIIYGVIFTRPIHFLTSIFKIPSSTFHHLSSTIYHKRYIKLVLLTLVLVITYSLAFSKFLSVLPSPEMLLPSNRSLTTEIYDRNGELLYQIYEGRNRKLVKIDELPKDLINATIAIEDKHFYSHPGIDPIAIIRALKTNLASRSEAWELQGASTITQQLVKNALLTPDKTYQRKIKEVILSFWVERVYSKQEILQMYFNEVPFGGPTWGIETAAEMYFKKPASKLSLAEAAFLAGLPAAPTKYSPYGTNPELGKKRQQEVLKKMVELGYINEAETNQTLLEPLNIKPPLAQIKAPHFVMYIRSLLASKYGQKVVSQGGLKVITSLDLRLQEMAEETVLKELEKLKGLKASNGAAMITNPKTGEILAMVGSKNYYDPKEGNFNATLSLRPPGSSIKVITYATAFKDNLTPGALLLDTPTTFPNPGSKPYSPINYDGTFHGPVTVRQALGSSFNVPAVKVLNMIGIDKFLQTAKEMGITTFNSPLDYGLSLTLGGGDVKMIDMMTVYGTLANGGVRVDLNPILEIRDSQGNILENHSINNKQQTTNNSGKKILTEEIAYLLTNILADDKARAPAFGAHSLLEIPGHTVAVKTGTSDLKRDNWTFGYTPNLVVGTWVGNFDNSPMDPRLASGITGAAPIWHTIMANILENELDLPFPKPSGIVEVIVDGHRDLGIAGNTPKSIIRYQRKNEGISFSDQFGIYIPTPSQTIQ